jgi:hypothetical protein
MTLNQYDIFSPYFFSIAGKCASLLESLGGTKEITSLAELVSPLFFWLPILYVQMPHQIGDICHQLRLAFDHI